MSDAYVPDDDALEETEDFESVPVPDDDEAGDRAPALVYPEKLPPEADAADVLEQSQPLPWDDDRDQG